jgi:hypothetical protein
MSRIRNIKPGYFKDADLFDAEKASGLPLRVAYAGLWTIADRAGRFKWKPREIKTDVLPYDDVDMGEVLEALASHKFIFKYKSAGFDYGFIPNFEKHQFINKNEAVSQLPEPPENINAQSQIVSVEQAQEIHCVTQTTDTDISDTDDVVAPAIAVASKPKPDRGTRWPADEKVPEDWFAPILARFRELGRAPPDLRLEAEKFVNYWASKSGKDATKLDWPKTFLNWCLNARTDQRSASERRFGNLKAGAGGAAFMDRPAGEGVEARPDNLVRLALTGGSGK